MADKVIDFGASEGFGEFTGWESQSTTDNTTNQRSVALNDKGDEAASDLHDEKQEVTSRYQCQSNTNTIPSAIGALVNALILSGINIVTGEGKAAEMTLTGHNHTNNAHAAEPALRTSDHGITVAKCFGATDFLSGTAGENASCIEGSVNITCEHADQNDGDGDHLVGENYNAKIEANSKWSGVPSANDDAAHDVTAETDEDTNTGFQTTAVVGVKTLTMS